MKKIIILMFLFSALIVAKPLQVFAGSNGDMGAGIMKLFFGGIEKAAGAMDDATKIPMEQRDIVTKQSKKNLEQHYADEKLKVGKFIGNVFLNEYFITLYGAQVKGAEGAMGLLFKKLSPTAKVDENKFLAAQLYDSDETKALLGAIQRGLESTKMFLRVSFLDTADVEPAFSITNKLSIVSGEAAKGSTAYTDLVSDVDKQKISQYFNQTDGNNHTFLALKENIIIGSILMPIYEAKINNQQNEMIVLFYRQVKDTPYVYVPTRDADRAKGSAILEIEQALKDTPDKKQSAFTVVLSKAGVDPNAPPVVSPQVNQAVKLAPKEELPLDILKKRYAKGEITKEDFDKMKEDLK
jgi:hypothetical protein